VVEDVGARLPGRGVWVTANRESIALAIRRGATGIFKLRANAPPPDLADRVQAGLKRRCLDGLGLGRKAAAIAVGFDQVEAAIRAAPPLVMVEAADGSAEGRERLWRTAIGLWETPPAVAGCFTAEELGVALGRGPVVHIVWLQERMARRWSAEVSRLAGFQSIVPPSWRPEFRWPVAIEGGEARYASSQQGIIPEGGALKGPRSQPCDGDEAV
jgi:uncharacterized protein